MVYNIVFSASHNVSKKKQEKIDKKTIKSANRYRRKGLMPSYKFERVYGSQIDENKFLMPLYDKLNSIAFQLIPFAFQDTKISVVGSSTVATYVNLIKDYLNQYHGISEEKIINVHEGPTDKLSLKNSIKNGSDVLKPIDKFAFIPSDVPLISIDDVIKEYDEFDHNNDLVKLNLNAKEKIFLRKPFFSRNYYQYILENNKLYGVKEPNVYYFSDRFDNWDVINVLYSKRELGKLKDFIIDEVSSLSVKDIFEISLDCFQIFYRTLYHEKLVGTISQVESLGNKFLKKEGVRFAIDHTDPFRLKDIDAWHDLMYYRSIFSKLDEKYNGLNSIYKPEIANALLGFNDYLKSKRKLFFDTIPIVYNFNNYMAKRALELEIKEYVKGNRFVETKRDDEEIGMSIAYLIERNKREK